MTVALLLPNLHPLKDANILAQFTLLFWGFTVGQ